MNNIIITQSSCGFSKYVIYRLAFQRRDWQVNRQVTQISNRRGPEVRRVKPRFRLVNCAAEYQFIYMGRQDPLCSWGKQEPRLAYLPIASDSPSSSYLSFSRSQRRLHQAPIDQFMSIISFYFLVAISTFARAAQNGYLIYVRYSNQLDIWKPLGEMTVPKNNFVNAQIVLNGDHQLIDRKLMVEKKLFATLKLTSPHSNTTYLTHIDHDQLAQFNPKSFYLETIQLTLSNGNLLSFDYALKSVKKGSDYSIHVVIKETVNAPVQIEEKPQEVVEPPQGLFGLLMQYKWYILLGFAVIFITSNSDPAKLNETIQQAQQQAQQQTQRRKK